VGLLSPRISGIDIEKWTKSYGIRNEKSLVLIHYARRVWGIIFSGTVALFIGTHRTNSVLFAFCIIGCHYASLLL
jgi:hypothetical protein